MFMLIVEFEINPSFSEHFNTLILEQAVNSLNKEKDCHFFTVTRDQDTNNKFTLSEVYTDSKAFDYHLTTNHFKNFDELVSDWVINKAIRSLE